MLAGRQLSAITAGALVTIMIAAPAAIAQRLIADDGAGTDQSNWVFLALAVIVAGYLLGGACAGFSAPTAPFVNGALAVAGGFGLIQLIAIVIRLARGEGFSLVGLVFNALLAASIGIVGAGLGARRARMDTGGGEPTG